MLLCEETASVLEMLKPKVKLVEEACECKLTQASSVYMHAAIQPNTYMIYRQINTMYLTFFSPQKEHTRAQFLQAHPRCWEFSQLRKNRFGLMYILPRHDI